MKFLPRGKSVLISFFLLILLLSMKLSAEAAFTETGTLTICLQDQKCEAELAVYRTADYCNGAFESLPEFEKMKTAETAAAAQREIEAFVQQINVQKTAPEFQGYTKDGQLCVEKIPVGMYLVMQIPHAEDRLTVQPFLVGVPYQKPADSEMGEEPAALYDVTAFPKAEEIPPVQEIPEPSEVPDAPSASLKTGDTTGRMLIVSTCLCLISASVIWVLKKFGFLK